LKKIIFILPFLILIACSVQKRKYQKGFYVSTTKHQKNSNTNSKKEIFSNTLVIQPSTLPVDENKDIEIIAAVNNKSFFLTKTPSLLFNQINDSLCDIILLKNGNEVKATILEITPALVKYKKCDDAESPLYIAKKSDIFKIKHANGTTDVFNIEESKPIQNNDQNNSKSEYKGNQKTLPLAIWAFVYAILGLIPFLGLFTSIRAIIYGIQALKTIRLNPTEYKGDLLATAAIVIGIIGLALLLLLIFAILAA